MAALEQARKQSTTGYLILPDPICTGSYGKNKASENIDIATPIFKPTGPGGSQVNSARDPAGCKITVPRDQTKVELSRFKARERRLKRPRRSSWGRSEREPRVVIAVENVVLGQK